MTHLNKESDQKEWRFTKLQKRSSFSHPHGSFKDVCCMLCVSYIPVTAGCYLPASSAHTRSSWRSNYLDSSFRTLVLPYPSERMAAVSSWVLGIELTVQTRWPRASFMWLYSASSFGQACHGLPIDYPERKIQRTRCMFNGSLVEHVLRRTDLRMPPFLQIGHIRLHGWPHWSQHWLTGSSFKSMWL